MLLLGACAALFLLLTAGLHPLSPEGGAPGALVGSGGSRTAAALLTLGAGLLLFTGLRRRSGDAAALATTLVFLFATTAFSSAARLLQPATYELVLSCLVLHLLLARDGRSWLAHGAVAILVLALVLSTRSDSSGPFGEGLLGSLVSPSRGLLPYFPYLLVVPLGLFTLREDGDLRRLWLTSLVLVAGIAVAGAFGRGWFEDPALGPRATTEAAPFLAVLTLPLWRAFRRLSLPARITAVAAVLVAAGTQTLSTRSVAAVEWNNGPFDRQPGRQRVWAVRDGQLAAAWSPVLDVRSRRPPAPEIPVESAAWRHVDLRDAANASYDHDPFFPGNVDSWSHYGRVMSGVIDARTNLFRFLPAGAPNVATTCRGASRIEVRVPPSPCTRVHVILAAGMTERTPGNPVVARGEVEYGDGSVEIFPLRLDRDVWEYAPARRASPIDEARLYRGLPDDAESLVKVTFTLARTASPVTALRLVNEDAGSPAGLTLFAATLER